MENLLSTARAVIILGALAMALVVSGCATQTGERGELPTATGESNYGSRYQIAPGDTVQIFVWRNPDVSTTVPVRPDGLLSAPLMEEVPAAGKTPAELARALEKELSEYLRDPLVTVIVNGFVGTFGEQIRVLGEATQPTAMIYTDDMTLLDVMIQAGGLTKFADGNNATLVRREGGEQTEYRVRLDDLIRKGDISANVDMRPGDVVIVPEAWF